MTKRVVSQLNGGDDVDMEELSRHKRHRDAGGSLSDVDNTGLDVQGKYGELSKAEVKEMGLMILQVLKDAVKDGRFLAVPFLRKPPKRLYPDYYVLIQNPIALEDIKKQLDEDGYASLGDVKADFELLFGNAKQYNLTESDIYQDAKDLLKLVHKTCSKLIPGENNDEKSKSPSHHRLLRAKLDKLLSKKDPVDGRLLSTEFMQLPSKKLWPLYYVEIKKPQCFDNIYKRLKRKEYHSAADFAADVELIFSNAMSFNLDGTQIFVDATTLRDYFRQLMSDLPPPHSLPEYAKPANKIRIRPVQATNSVAVASSSKSVTKQEQPSSTPLTLKVPPTQASTPQAPVPASQVQVPATPASVVNTSVLPVAPVTASRHSMPKAHTPQPPTTTESATPQPTVAGQSVSFLNATSSHYPRSQTPYVPPPVPASMPTAIAPLIAPTPSVLRASSVVNAAQTQSQSPAPQVVYPLSRQLKSISVQIQPTNRSLALDFRDGVKSWSVRLGIGETSLVVNEVTYMGEEEEDGSDDDRGDVVKEEDGDNMDVDYEASPSKKKGKARGRGRPPKAITLAVKAAQAAAASKAAKSVKKKATQKVGEVQLKLNNTVVNEQPERSGEWSVHLVSGTNVIEVGEVGGMVWKLYAERLLEV